jgi:hypothetical protein
MGMLLICTSVFWSAPATAGANTWTWIGYPAANPGCDRQSLTAVKDCFIQYVDGDLAAPGRLGASPVSTRTRRITGGLMFGPNVLPQTW